VTARLTPPVSARDHAQGPAAGPVTLVEYGDYECPHCGRAYPMVKAVQRSMGDNLRFVFRNFPLTSSHEHAEHAAEMAEAAGDRGKFWEMHDRLFEHQRRLADGDLLDHASRIGLDLGRFERELTGHAHAERVREDFLSGVRSGVNGTPTFFINGARHDGAWGLEPLLEAVEGAELESPRR
jgi:protein-disulfide isomerase